MLTQLKLINIVRADLDAGKAITRIYQSGDFENELKSDNSSVTAADMQSQTIITMQLAATAPPVLSGESGKTRLG